MSMRNHPNHSCVTSVTKASAPILIYKDISNSFMKASKNSNVTSVTTLPQLHKTWLNIRIQSMRNCANSSVWHVSQPLHKRHIWEFIFKMSMRKSNILSVTNVEKDLQTMADYKTILTPNIVNQLNVTTAWPSLLPRSHYTDITCLVTKITCFLWTLQPLNSVQNVECLVSTNWLWRSICTCIKTRTNTHLGNHLLNLLQVMLSWLRVQFWMWH